MFAEESLDTLWTYFDNEMCPPGHECRAWNSHITGYSTRVDRCIKCLSLPSFNPRRQRLSAALFPHPSLFLDAITKLGDSCSNSGVPFPRHPVMEDDNRQAHETFPGERALRTHRAIQCLPGVCSVVSPPSAASP